jgi:hypothetical protein
VAIRTGHTAMVCSILQKNLRFQAGTSWNPMCGPAVPLSVK